MSCRQRWCRFRSSKRKHAARLRSRPSATPIRGKDPTDHICGFLQWISTSFFLTEACFNYTQCRVSEFIRYCCSSKDTHVFHVPSLCGEHYLARTYTEFSNWHWTKGTCMATNVGNRRLLFLAVTVFRGRALCRPGRRSGGKPLMYLLIDVLFLGSSPKHLWSLQEDVSHHRSGMDSKCHGGNPRPRWSVTRASSGEESNLRLDLVHTET